MVDEVSGPLSDRFYRNLESMPRDLALRDAQLACLRGELIVPGPDQPPASLPVFWAGFTLYGSPHQVRSASLERRAPTAAGSAPQRCTR